MPSVVLKAIVESALWTPAVLRGVCEAAVDGGADYVKTSTGFHPAGGATVDAVATMRAAVGSRARVKASGGLRRLEDCTAMIGAGADRIGSSSTRALLAELATRLTQDPAAPVGSQVWRSAVSTSSSRRSHSRRAASGPPRPTGRIASQ